MFFDSYYFWIFAALLIIYLIKYAIDYVHSSPEYLAWKKELSVLENQISFRREVDALGPVLKKADGLLDDEFLSKLVTLVKKYVSKNLG